jgi:hypothetical protein
LPKLSETVTSNGAEEVKNAVAPWNTGSRKDVQCFACGEMGHVRRYCKADKVPQPEVLPVAARTAAVVTSGIGLMEEYESKNFVFPCFLNGKPIRALRDSGCHFSLISETLVDLGRAAKRPIPVKSVFGEIRPLNITDISISSPIFETKRPLCIEAGVAKLDGHVDLIIGHNLFIKYPDIADPAVRNVGLGEIQNRGVALKKADSSRVIETINPDNVDTRSRNKEPPDFSKFISRPDNYGLERLSLSHTDPRSVSVTRDRESNACSVVDMAGGATNGTLQRAGQATDNFNEVGDGIWKPEPSRDIGAWMPADNDLSLDEAKGRSVLIDTTCVKGVDPTVEKSVTDDRASSVRSFEAGDRVLTLIPNDAGSRWDGPHIILKRINKMWYEVGIGRRTSVVYIDLLRMWYNHDRILKAPRAQVVKVACPNQG